MLQEPVVVFVPGIGYLTNSLVRPYADNVDLASEFGDVNVALAVIESFLYESFDDFEIIYLSVARAKDDQEYEAERQEML